LGQAAQGCNNDIAPDLTVINTAGENIFKGTMARTPDFISQDATVPGNATSTIDVPDNKSAEVYEGNTCRHRMLLPQFFCRMTRICLPALGYSRINCRCGRPVEGSSSPQLCCCLAITLRPALECSLEAGFINAYAAHLPEI